MEIQDTYTHICTPDQLKEFCDRCSKSSYVGFDTEFVSENRYRPDLCLLQVAIDNEIAIIDTLAIDDMGVFWNMLTEGQHITIAHAAREEFLFCYRASGKRPKKLVDVQLAAGFVGFEYPASYSNLVSQLLGVYLAKGETRTDWSKRPLTDKQITYALGDVEHLHLLCQQIQGLLKKSNRIQWYSEEVESWMDDLIEVEHHPQWHRISGAARLNRRSLAILRELWIFRNGQAERKNRSPKRIVPDDLMVELSKRGSAKISNFRSIRGFDNRVSKHLANEISEAIQRGNEVDENQLPEKLDRTKNINLGLVGQFLSTMLGVVCRTKGIAPGLVGTTQDVRTFAAWRLGHLPKDPPPKLADGWRAEIVGEAIEKALDGKLAIRVSNPKSEHPLSIEEFEGDKT